MIKQGVKECIKSVELDDCISVSKQNRSEAPRILNKGMTERTPPCRHYNPEMKRERKKPKVWVE